MDNTRGILLMIFAMAGFAVEDVFVKRASATLPVGQILPILGLGGAVVFAALAARRGRAFWSREVFDRAVMLRNGGEVVGTVCFVTALALIPLSVASAILQATPLAVTAGAALFLAEPVGWRRWAAVAVGFAGVLMIVRPGFEGFAPASLFAVLAVVGLAARDLATRAVPKRISSLQLSAWAFATLVPTGLLLLAVTGTGAVMPPRSAAIDLVFALSIGILAYYAITASMRAGEISVIAPFRYLRLIFALGLGMAVFGERPDGWTLAGAGVIIATGLYTLSRERRRAAPPPAGSLTRTDLTS